MKKINLKSKVFLFWILGVVLASVILIIGTTIILKPKISTQTETVSTQSVDSQITASGSIDSQNSADLHFQIGGKLTYLPFKEGDSVNSGQTIASLDSYTIQQQLQIALNNYTITRDTFDQTQQNNQTGVLQGQQKFLLNNQNTVGLSEPDQSNVINDMAKRIVDQNQANLNNSVIQVQLANYAFQLANITTPFSGVITHEDVTTSGVNITPVTTFSIKDPNAIIFKAQVDENDIDFVSDGANAKVYINGTGAEFFQGNVIAIHPDKVTLPNGENVYIVDIQSTDMVGKVKFGQTGLVQIDSNTSEATKLVPTWTILSNQYIWVEEGNQKILKTVTVGKTHGNNTEILSGLNDNDKIIVNPQSVAAEKYKIL